jgi:hypothetical protein
MNSEQSRSRNSVNQPLLQAAASSDETGQGARNFSKTNKINDIAEILVGTYSHHSINGFDDEAKSRVLFASSFSNRFSFANPNNTAQLSTFLLLNSMIGSGILNQPYVFRESGIIGAVREYRTEFIYFIIEK